jgi:hypothetical protein
LDFALRKSERAMLKQTGSDIRLFFAAHPDVAARTAGTNASGNRVTPSKGAASMRSGM